ncbi:MAG: single-stranded DNA-binding protein [bacterium]
MINKVTLIGNVGQDAELRTTQSGQPFAYFRLATNESYQDSRGQWHTSTEWHTIKVWDKSSNRAAATIRKGARVYIEGQLKSFKGKDEKMLWEVKATTWRLLDKEPDHSPGQKPDPFLPPEPPSNNMHTPSQWGEGFTRR